MLRVFLILSVTVLPGCALSHSPPDASHSVDVVGHPPFAETTDAEVADAPHVLDPCLLAGRSETVFEPPRARRIGHSVALIAPSASDRGDWFTATALVRSEDSGVTGVSDILAYDPVEGTHRALFSTDEPYRVSWDGFDAYLRWGGVVGEQVYAQIESRHGTHFDVLFADRSTGAPSGPSARVRLSPSPPLQTPFLQMARSGRRAARFYDWTGVVVYDVDPAGLTERARFTVGEAVLGGPPILSPSGNTAALMSDDRGILAFSISRRARS